MSDNQGIVTIVDSSVVGGKNDEYVIFKNL